MDSLRNFARQMSDADAQFGPQYLEAFDFTLTFESSLFNILPASLLIGFCPLYLLYCSGQPVVAPQIPLFWTKVVVTFMLFCLEVVRAALWGLVDDFKSEVSVAGTAISCLAALGIICIFVLENRHSLHSSSFLSVFLTICIFLDAAQARSMFLRHSDLQKVAATTVAIASFKFILLLLQEVPKHQKSKNISEEKSELCQDATGGFWNRTLLIWINPMFLFAFRNKLTMNDLQNLGPEFSSRRLMENFEPVWEKSEKTKKNALFNATIRSLLWPFLASAIPRILYSVFNLSGPFLIERILSNLANQDDASYVKGSLIASTALVYVGVAIARVSHIHLSRRVATFIRGVLISQIIKKNLTLKTSDAKKSAALTLMTADVEGIMLNSINIHEIWMSFFDVGICLYFISLFIGNAWFLPVIPVVIAFALAWKIGNLNGPAIAVWNKAIEKRVSKMAIVLLQIRGIKMTGLEGVMTDFMQKLRIDEIKHAERVRKLRVLLTSVFPLGYWGTPILVVTGGLFWTTFRDGLNPVSLFTTMAFVGLLDGPMGIILNFWPGMGMMLACFSRIQEFLLIEARDDPRHSLAAPASSLDENEKHANTGSEQSINEKEKLSPDDRCISLSKVSVASKTADKDILKNIDLSIKEGTLASIVGPVGAGKSVFLKSLLGETVLNQGSLSVKGNRIAYCDQKPWIPDTTIQEMITAGSQFDKSWYDIVVRACALDYDFEQLTDGDQTITGTNGSLLSGGQKQRGALARAVYSKAPILVLDDVLSALDENTAEAIYLNLFSATGLLKRQGRTTILATHSVKFLHQSDQIIVVDKDGSVKENTEEASIAQVAQANQLNKMGHDSSDSDEENVAVIDDVVQNLKLDKELTSNHGADLSLYSYFLSSVPRSVVAAFVILIACVSLMEYLPMIYLRIWVQNDPTNKSGYFIGFVLLGVACMIVNAAAAWVYMIVAMPKIGLNLHKIFLESVMKSTIPFLTSTSNGALLNRFSQDMTLLGQEMPHAFYALVYVFFGVLTNTGMIASGAQYAGLIIPFTILVIYLLQLFYLRTSRQLRILDLEAKTPLYTKLSETNMGIEHIRAFGWQEKTLNDTLDALDYSQKSFYYMFCIQRWLSVVLDLYTAAVATILVTMALTWKQTSSQPGLGLALVGCLDYSVVMRKLITWWVNIETSLGAVARLRSFVDETPKEEDDEDAFEQLPGWPETGVVKFDHVNASYGSSDTAPKALDDVTFAAEAGEQSAIRGRTGSGKSTVVLVLLNALKHTGSVTIDSVNISKIPRHQLRSLITTIPQDPIDIPGTVRNNLLPLDMLKTAENVVVRNDAAIMEVLEKVGLAQHVATNGGLDVPVDSMEFSHGQKQLLGVARAILHKIESGSKIVIMDEATSSMDRGTEENLLRLLRDTFGDCTRIVISHRPAGYIDSDATFTLERGKLISAESRRGGQ